MTLELDNVEPIKGGEEKSSISIFKLPNEILMNILKRLPISKDRLEFGLTCQRFWNIMVRSRQPEETSVLLIRNETTAKKLLKWEETLSFVNTVLYGAKNGHSHCCHSEDCRFVGSVTELFGVRLNLELETSNKTDRTLQLFSTICRNASYKNMDDSVRYIFDSYFEDNYGYLTILGFRNKRITTDMAIKSLATKFPHVKKVMSICSTSSNYEANENSINRTDLRKRWTTFVGFDHRATQQGEIREMKILLASFKDISELKITEGYLITDGDIDTLTGSLSPRLESISFNGRKITDRGIIAIANQFPCLQSLRLFGAEHLTDFSIRMITKKNLKELTLRGLASSHVSKRQLKALIGNLGGIEFLDLSGNGDLISDTILETISKKCRKIKGLRLLESYKITRSGLNTMLSELGDQLLYLDLSYCGIQQNYLSKILEHCPNLHSLRIIDPAFDKPSCALLRTKIENVDVLSEESDDSEVNSTWSNGEYDLLEEIEIDEGDED